MLIPDIELAEILMLCDKKTEHFSGLTLKVQLELKQYCNEIVKYNGTTHELAGGKIFTDDTLLKPAKKLVKSLKKRRADQNQQ